METNEMPGISVVIPHRNQSALLMCMLGYISSQTHKLTQIIIVDDYSSKSEFNTVQEICSSNLCANNVELVRLNKWSGPNAAINSGLEKTRYEFVALTACDDWLHPDFFQKSIETLESFPSAAFIFSDPATFSGDVTKRQLYKLSLSAHQALFSPTDFVSIWNRISFTFPTNTVIYRKRNLMKVGGFRPDLTLYSDWFTCHVLALTYGACYIPSNLTAFCQSSASYSASFQNKSPEKLSCFNKTLEQIRTDWPLAAKNIISAGILPDYDLFFLTDHFLHKNNKMFFTRKSILRTLRRHYWNKIRDRTSVKLRMALRKFLTR